QPPVPLTDPPTAPTSPLSLHDALPIYEPGTPLVLPKAGVFAAAEGEVVAAHIAAAVLGREAAERFDGRGFCYIETGAGRAAKGIDRKSTRLNSSHVSISYAVFCLKKKK